MNMKQFFPSHVELEVAAVRAVAGAMLKVLHHRCGETGTFNIRNVLIDVRTLYEVHSWECARAASEALTWLSAQSLISQAPEGDPGWCNLTRAGLQAAQASDFEKWSSERELPTAFLHPTIVAECMDSFRLGRFDTAVFEAFKTLEVAIRSAAGLGHDLVGVPLASRAFNPEDGQLTYKGHEKGERVALMNLMCGALGSYKNPTSHRRVDLEPLEAREMLILASHLLRIVEARTEARQA